MMTEDNIDRNMKKLLLDACRDSAGEKYVIDPELANDVYNFIVRQINDYSDTAVINDEQYNQMLAEGELGLFALIYINNFTTKFEMVQYEPLHVSALNLLRLKFSEVLNGKKRAFKIEDMRSKQPLMVANR